MAVDTRNKRMSLIGFGSPVPTVFPNPDGAIDNEAERYQYLWLYAAVLGGIFIEYADVVFDVRTDDNFYHVETDDNFEHVEIDDNFFHVEEGGE